MWCLIQAQASPARFSPFLHFPALLHASTPCLVACNVLLRMAWRCACRSGLVTSCSSSFLPPVCFVTGPLLAIAPCPRTPITDTRLPPLVAHAVVHNPCFSVLPCAILDLRRRQLASVDNVRMLRRPPSAVVPLLSVALGRLGGL